MKPDRKTIFVNGTEMVAALLGDLIEISLADDETAEAVMMYVAPEVEWGANPVARRWRFLTDGGSYTVDQLREAGYIAGE